MNLIIESYEHLNPIGGYGQMKFATDASDLGLPPGAWPERIPAAIGNARPFLLIERVDEYARYRQEFGMLELQIWND